MFRSRENTYNNPERRQSRETESQVDGPLAKRRRVDGNGGRTESERSADRSSGYTSEWNDENASKRDKASLLRQRHLLFIKPFEDRVQSTMTDSRLSQKGNIKTLAAMNEVVKEGEIIPSALAPYSLGHKRSRHQPVMTGFQKAGAWKADLDQKKQNILNEAFKKSKKKMTPQEKKLLKEYENLINTPDDGEDVVQEEAPERAGTSGKKENATDYTTKDFLAGSQAIIKEYNRGFEECDLKAANIELAAIKKMSTSNAKKRLEELVDSEENPIIIEMANAILTSWDKRNGKKASRG